MKIMVVDDNEHSIGLYRRVLTKLADVSFFTNPVDAMKEDWATYDMAIVDYIMDPVDGKQLIDWAVDRYRESLPMVVLFSGVTDADGESVVDSIGHRSVSFLPKTGSIMDVLTRLGDAVDAHSSSGE